jgi:hypothetical protein
MTLLLELFLDDKESVRFEISYVFSNMVTNARQYTIDESLVALDMMPGFLELLESEDEERVRKVLRQIYFML